MRVRKQIYVADFERSFSLRLGLSLSKGPATTGISRNEKNGKVVHVLGVTVK